MAILLEVVTPERLVLSEEVEEVTAPGYEGEFGVLPGHTPFLVLLRTGEVMYRINGHENWMAISGGVAEVLPERVIILAEAAELAREIDVERAQRAKNEAEEKLKGLSPLDPEYATAQAALERALTRLRVAEKAG
ncbi:MAG: F0F1 ATP synthase subunit epsilon [Deltaproteobacteria bacterium]|nr:MAG: F0F1 ATP synthase subunit epsilon [Deltaproteobacteria bacterium]